MSDHVDMQFETCYTNFLTVMIDTKEQVINAWETMKEGSTVIYPLGSTFYSSAREVFVDRFGIRWGIMTETAE
jgi:PhnB protein